jgi:hypothetical protein
MPWSKISPEVAGINPAIIFSSVDFPHPLGPMTLVKVPWRRVKLTPSRAVR